MMQNKRRVYFKLIVTLAAVALVVQACGQNKSNSVANPNARSASQQAAAGSSADKNAQTSDANQSDSSAVADKAQAAAQKATAPLTVNSNLNFSVGGKNFNISMDGFASKVAADGSGVSANIGLNISENGAAAVSSGLDITAPKADASSSPDTINMSDESKIIMSANQDYTMTARAYVDDVKNPIYFYTLFKLSVQNVDQYFVVAVNIPNQNVVKMMLDNSQSVGPVEAKSGQLISMLKKSIFTNLADIALSPLVPANEVDFAVDDIKVQLVSQNFRGSIDGDTQKFTFVRETMLVNGKRVVIDLTIDDPSKPMNMPVNNADLAAMGLDLKVTNVMSKDLPQTNLFVMLNFSKHGSSDANSSQDVLFAEGDYSLVTSGQGSNGVLMLSAPQDQKMDMNTAVNMLLAVYPAVSSAPAATNVANTTTTSAPAQNPAATPAAAPTAPAQNSTNPVVPAPTMTTPSSAGQSNNQPSAPAIKLLASNTPIAVDSDSSPDNQLPKESSAPNNNIAPLTDSSSVGIKPVEQAQPQQKPSSVAANAPAADASKKVVAAATANTPTNVQSPVKNTAASTAAQSVAADDQTQQPSLLSILWKSTPIGMLQSWWSSGSTK